MAAVITVAQQKGGAGKTTLAAHLAAALARHHRVALLDIDPQRSLMRWSALREAARARADGGAGDVPPAVAASDPPGWRLDRDVAKLRREQAAVVIVDSPPQVDHDARRAIRVADLVLVPIQPSLPDLWAARETLALAAAERRQARLVLNRLAGGEKAAASARSLIAGELGAEAEAGLLGALGNRVGYSQAFARGLGATEVGARSAAAAEVEQLAREISRLLGLQP